MACRADKRRDHGAREVVRIEQVHRPASERDHREHHERACDERERTAAGEALSEPRRWKEVAPAVNELGEAGRIDEQRRDAYFVAAALQLRCELEAEYLGAAQPYPRFRHPDPH